MKILLLCLLVASSWTPRVHCVAAPNNEVYLQSILNTVEELIFLGVKVEHAVSTFMERVSDLRNERKVEGLRLLQKAKEAITEEQQREALEAYVEHLEASRTGAEYIADKLRC